MLGTGRPTVSPQSPLGVLPPVVTGCSGVFSSLARPPGLSVSPRLAVRDSQRFSVPLHSENRVVILFCNLVGSGQQASRYVSLLPVFR